MKSTSLTSPGASPKRRGSPCAVMFSIAAVGIALTGCTAEGAANTKSSSGESAGGGEGVTVAVIGGKSDDPFWSTVKRGVRRRRQGRRGRRRHCHLARARRTTTTSAPTPPSSSTPPCSQGPTAVVGPNWFPRPRTRPSSRSSSQGIPRHPLQRRRRRGRRGGRRAELHRQPTTTTAGKAGGVVRRGGRQEHPVCQHRSPARPTPRRAARASPTVPRQQRRDSSTQLALPSSNFGNPSAVTQAIKAALLEDDIDRRASSPSAPRTPTAPPAPSSRPASADKVKLGTFDMSQSQLDRIKDGNAAVLHRPAALPAGLLRRVDGLPATSAYGLYLPQNPILTGPALITAETSTRRSRAPRPASADPRRGVVGIRPAPRGSPCT